ncbi:hypothetical protein [uncultured Ruegeria sp.]|uniref:hypothetical protein n=1 Tax=uncultured Ruegeria sp. TaxID=259304 RepID=UPI0026115CBA|nr:hypothetical protein [uncultured Ruegeria sp.]
MLPSSELKDWLNKDLPRLDKVLLILATSACPLSVSQIREIAASAGLRELKNKNWNVSQVLGNSKGKAIRTDKGWELTNAGKLHLRDLGVSKMSPSAMQVAIDLRAHLVKIVDGATREFVEEAIKCHEAELFRAAVVMSWLGAMDVLHKHVHTNHLNEFNAEAKRVNSRWKPAKTPDDLGRMGESDFLDRLAAISVIGKNAKEELQKALGLRNGCGHPNTLKVGPNKSAAHIETLLQNVFERY